METIIISLFVLGYLAITLEHNLKVDKLIPALAMMALMWAIISLAHLPVFDVNTELKELEPTHIDEILLHHLGKTAEIIIFLLGAMTIVEIIDYFNGFYTIKNFIKTRSKKGLLWIFGNFGVYTFSHYRQPYGNHSFDYHIAKSHPRQRYSPVVRRFDYYLCKCRWSLVAHW
jgi:Na+/H+ antiporter NhaD/arsenite permease-like protein